MTDNAIELCHVVKRYGRRVALDGLTMSIRRGTVTGLVGSNGAGKTTTLSVLTGLLSIGAGEVDLLGLGPFPRTHAGRVTIMPQDSELPPNTPVVALLAYYAGLQGFSIRQAREEARRVVGWVNLADRAGACVRTLSHGMRRRVVIAQAFLGDPDLVSLDEPMSGLDPVEVVNIRKLIHKRRAGQTVVVSSHNLHEIERLCDDVVFIENGRMVKQDTVHTIVGRDQCLEYVLAGPVPAMDELRRRLPDVELESRDGEAAGLYARCRGADVATEVNRTIIGWLLEQDADIVSIRRGADLEQAYLRHVRSKCLAQSLRLG